MTDEKYKALIGQQRRHLVRNTTNIIDGQQPAPDINSAIIQQDGQFVGSDRTAPDNMLKD